MIIITGAAGFIGSCLVSKLNQEGFNDLILVDDFSKESKVGNLIGKKYTLKVDRKKFFNWLDNNHKMVQFIFHIGARTDTTEFDYSVFEELNISYSQEVWKRCCQFGLPLIYASSAATYGAGETGYSDEHKIIPGLKPLNPYGESKQAFDLWALEQEQKPYFWMGMKFFNVFGPNEYHKGRMASVVYHAFNQIKQSGKIRLFRSHRPDYKDGEQKRDFIYVMDVLDVLFWAMNNRKSRNNGIFNLGTGKAETFNSLANGLFKAIGVEPEIEYIDTPLDIRDKYQYFTEAKMEKLLTLGYQIPCFRLEDAIEDYVKNFLTEEKYF
jgi:ADP-L-glycero-D-manno-heptose 6-epimerase